MKKHKVSVIIPSFNRRDSIGKTIQSVLDQTYKNIEIIVVDDGSTDGTSREVAKFMKKNPNVFYYYKDNGGCASALNYGIKKSTGVFISWLSSDDWYKPTIIEKSVNEHLKSPELGMTYTKYDIKKGNRTLKVYESYQPMHKKDAIRKLNESCFINGSSIMVKKKIFYHIGLFNENFKYAQDYDFYFRIAYHYSIKLIPESLLNYHDNADTNNPNWLGKEISAGKHSNEGEPVRERYRLMFEKNRPKVCAMICMKNEEELIENCINDLIMYVDYIVIFNDGSTDKSLEIVKRYEKVVDIYNEKAKGNIRTEGKDRQKLLKMAQKTGCAWILMIDADEIMDDIYKTEIFKEMRIKKINMYHYLSYNFWRSYDKYRVDEVWFKGWFAKLFRNLKGLKYNTKEKEHCGSIPTNIPGAPQWYNHQKSTHAAKSQVRIKHYGYADWNRVELKYRQLMERDDKPPEGRHNRYDRMVNEKKINLMDWNPVVYYLPKGIGIDKNKQIAKTDFGIDNNSNVSMIFLGKHDNCRSVMAKYIARSLGFNAGSMGVSPENIHSSTLKVMEEIGIKIEDHIPTSILGNPTKEYDYIICLKPEMEQYIKYYTGKKIIWMIHEPEEFTIESLRIVRDKIMQKMRELE